MGLMPEPKELEADIEKAAQVADGLAEAVGRGPRKRAAGSRRAGAMRGRRRCCEEMFGGQDSWQVPSRGAARLARAWGGRQFSHVLASAATLLVLKQRALHDLVDERAEAVILGPDFGDDGFKVGVLRGGWNGSGGVSEQLFRESTGQLIFVAK